MEALIYDVHGNLPALDAVLNDAAAHGVTAYVLGGDYALFGGWPKETVQRLQQLPNTLWIRGNGERWTAHPDDAPDNPVVPHAISAAREALGETLVDDLGALPTSSTRESTLICHASPESDLVSFSPEPDDNEPELLAGVTATRLIFGHTHLPFQRQAGGIELINPGSVGLPYDHDTRAAYALLHDDGTIEHRRVTYDHATSAAKMRAFGEEWAEIVAKRIEQARGDV